MIVYQADKTQFLADVDTNAIDQIIYDRFKERLKRHTSEAELRSWRESMGYMHRILSDPQIPADSGIAIEYKLPQTSKRVDLIVSGYDDQNRESAVIIELKQWSEAQKTDMDGIVRTRFSGRLVETSHPSYQAWTYACLLRDFNEYVYSNDLQIAPCAYLHNFSHPGSHASLLDPAYADYLQKAPSFLRSDAQRLREFIRRHVRKGDRGRVLYSIENGVIRPSKNLADSVGSMLAGNPEFLMIDDQKVVYETALALQSRSHLAGFGQNAPSLAADPTQPYAATHAHTTSSSPHPPQKHVLIVQGGPGTGKTVVAVNLLGEFTRKRLLAQYVSKNAAPRAVYEHKLTGQMRPTRFRNLFKGSGSFTETPTDAFDALIVDEAHRLNEKSGLYRNQGDHQIREIINAARFSVFFLDEDQRVTLHDIGTREEIVSMARQAGAHVTHAQLASQFRCDGSDGYLAWLDDRLQIRETANQDLAGLDYAFKVFDDPAALRDEIFHLNAASNKARLVAGYCWNWVSKKNPDLHDIVLPGHDFAMKWNLASDSSLWIVAPNSVNEIGCIHTCQGLEVDHIGVIIGPDLLVRNGTVLTRPEARAKTDHSIRGWKTRLKHAPDETRGHLDLIIKNTYRTLMTRGMKSCYVWSADPETREWLQSGI